MKRILLLCVMVGTVVCVVQGYNDPPSCTPPSITLNPTNQTVVQGSNAVFTVTASGSAPLSYQWSTNNINLTNGGNISGAQNNTLTISNVTTSDAGNYAVVVYNACGSITSSVVTLNVMGWTVDSDYDGVSDAQEIVDGTDPNDPNSVLNIRLCYWPFDDTNTWIGAEGQLPLLATNVIGVPSWNTNAVLIDSTNPAVLQYRDVETNGNANINLRNGTIRFWFSPDWSSTNAGGVGPQSEGRLIEMGSEGTTNGWWGLVIGSAGTNIYFGTQTNSTSTLTTNLAATISWTTNIWHQVVLTYSAGNSLLYLDGQPVMINGLGVAFYPGPTARAQGFTIGSSVSGTNQAQGIFDELETFNYMLTAAVIQTNYNQACTQKGAGGNSHFSIRLLAPANNTFYAEPVTIPLLASVIDLDSTVTNVSFYRSSIQITGITNTPYQYTWPIVAAGQYSLTAVACDAAGLAVASAPVSITVTNLCSSY